MSMSSLHSSFNLQNGHPTHSQSLPGAMETKQPAITSRRPFQNLSANATDRSITSMQKDKATKQSIVPKNNLNEDNDEAIQSKEPMFPIRRSDDIFRRQTSEVDSDLEGMWALKRANPVNLDDDDEESLEADLYQSPTKRSRTQVLNWEDLDSLMTLSSGSSHLGP